VGEIVLDNRPITEALSEADVTVTVIEKSTRERIPCRVTVLNSDGALMTVGAKSNTEMAVRAGVIYCGHGVAKFGLPAGRYTIFAGRGPEYGIARQTIEVEQGQTTAVKMQISREVDTSGYVSCDTHVHTLTHSRHGDASIEERMLTLAGEHLEFPIATDHNVHIDYEPLARKLGVRKYFTPVIGNEVTTKIGHFNIFPVGDVNSLPDYKLTEWSAIADSIEKKTGAEVIILNHARDNHSNFRPFGPKNHLGLVGRNLDGWKLRANAMELINSGAEQSDFMQLYRDWFGLLNHGYDITPVGCSDSHDVARHFVGQARTFIKTDDSDPANIDIAKTVENFRAGKVSVSLGLFTTIEVNGKYGPGELVPKSDKVTVKVKVQGPSWVQATRVSLYANGELIESEEIASSDSRKPGLKWSGGWTFENLGHDVHLVAVANGPGVKELYWPIAKPYQPTSKEWKSYVVGSTGAVWVDSDGDGKKTPAIEYAKRIVKDADGQVKPAIKKLAKFNSAICFQVFDLLMQRGDSLIRKSDLAAVKSAGSHVEKAYYQFLEAWKASRIARLEK
jgi:hypothetical protein